MDGEAFLQSALLQDGLVSEARVASWLESRRQQNEYCVTRIPFSGMTTWQFEPRTGNLVHQSGRFFRVEGIEVRTDFGPTSRWMQPIINQPEIGILGFLVQKRDGCLHFLVQAKMEPGNPNLVQLSPTVQATRSNYTQVHGGSRPPYLEFFLCREQARVHVDQLQSEQGARYLRKRNRNMIVEVPEGARIPDHEDFCWLTLGQIYKLLQHDNVVNMDSRTVLSCIQYGRAGRPLRREICPADVRADFSAGVLESALADEGDAVHDFDSIISWITEVKTRFFLETRIVPLNTLEDWHVDDSGIRHETGRFFSVSAFRVQASNREVRSWEQPLIESVDGGILCFICQRKKGILHFLVQARVEPGNLDAVEMAPTLQCTPKNYDTARPDSYPPFLDLVLRGLPEQVRYRAMQSEEGGRFYQDENQYLVLEIERGRELTLPQNYIWMTIRQMKELIRFNNYFNIEARGLIACLGIGSDCTAPQPSDKMV